MPPPPGKSVLLIDDSQRQKELLRAVLAKVAPGSRFFAVENGELGIEHLERVAAGDAPGVDLVIVDRQMPRVDGFELLAKAPALPGVPMLMLTGSSDPEHVQRAREGGASDYLIKPPEEAGWEALGRELALWTPGAARWGAKEIVRVSGGSDAVGMRRVDMAGAGMDYDQAGNYPAGHLDFAARFAQLPLSLVLDVGVKDHGVWDKRRVFVRVLFALGWTKPEIRLYMKVSVRWLEDEEGKPAQELCGFRAALLK